MGATVRFLALLASASWFGVFLPQILRAQSPGDTPRAILLTTEGTVEVSQRARPAWNPGQTNQMLDPGDRVRTAARGRASIRLSDLSVLRMNELTLLEIRPAQPAGKRSLLNLNGGSLYFFNRERPSEMQFQTPLSSGAIRGTEFHLAVDGGDGRTTLTLLDGEVRLENAQGGITLRSGEQAVVTPGQAPVITPSITAINIIQWALYYPAVLVPEEAGLSEGERTALAESLRHYAAGDLLQALAAYPDGRIPASDSERLYLAALLLAVGQVDQAQNLLGSAGLAASEVRAALVRMIATVKNQPQDPPGPFTLASSWMAESYARQSTGDLNGALHAASEAVRLAPKFSFASVRVAELHFSFGRISAAAEALDQALALSPRNAQALALRGFLLAAGNRTAEALTWFDRAIAIDGALGNAWLGRGLCLIRRGQSEAGRADLQVAATLEPNRAIFRSYLGKALSHSWTPDLAAKEFRRAKELDPNDPTVYLYSALYLQGENRVNEAIRDLERSSELNENRRIFRSRLLLDQDQAVRSANLARIYRDAGMEEVSIREATRAVDYDYANASAHLFLANSYAALLDPNQFNLRYETPWYSELLIANLLAPVGGGGLSQNISQQEYSRLFEGNHLGLLSGTEYLSRGSWVQYGSQYGIVHNTGYAIDAYYRTDPGQRVNNDFEALSLSAKVKQQITPQDSVLLQVTYYDAESGDVSQYYDPLGATPGIAAPSSTLRVSERQDPNLIIGYNHEWNPGIHTLLLAGRFEDTLNFSDPNSALVFLRPSGSVASEPFSIVRHSEFALYNVELQQLWQTVNHTVVVGARYQHGETESESRIFDSFGPVFGRLHTNQFVETDLRRESVYAYHQWQVCEPLRLIAGISYDRLHFPGNIDLPPLIDEETSTDQLSPKAGMILQPWANGYVRAAYTRSLGGVLFDPSIRLEPTQVAGFLQAYRSLLPESVAGLVPGTRFETYGLSFDQKLTRSTFFGVSGEVLRSEGDRNVGVVTSSGTGFIPIPNTAGISRQNVEFEERSMTLTLNQLAGDVWSLGTRYRLSHAELETRFPEVSPTVPGASRVNQDVSAWLQQLSLFAHVNHPSGFFFQAEGHWYHQTSAGYTPALPGDSFWHENLFLGYRFFRRHAEARVGLLNVLDQDYRLNPLTLYSDLPRERTIIASFRFYF